MRFCVCQSFESGGSGSGVVTSRIAPPRMPRSSADTSARWSSTPPRARLISPAPGRSAANCFSPIKFCVSGVRGMLRMTKSASSNAASRSSGVYIAWTYRDGRPVLRTPRTRRPMDFATCAEASPIFPTPTTVTVFPLIGVL